MARKADGEAIHASIMVECPHCAKHMEAAEVVRAYQREVARRYRAAHPERTAATQRRWSERKKAQAVSTTATVATGA